ncbi:hypothetical protein D9M71_740950 [compost metagenome]
MPLSAISEPAMSATGICGMAGVPSGARLRLTTPVSACIARSCAGRLTLGPVWPKALIAQYTSVGLIALQLS